MRFLKAIFSFIIFGISISAFGQVDSILKKRLSQFALKPNTIWIQFDNTGNLFAITRDNELIRYDSLGQYQSTFRERVLGKIQSVDLRNPLQLLVFYPESAQVLQLDNMLYPNARYRVEEALACNSPLFCRSFDNQIWFYDDRSSRLKKLGLDLITQFEGPFLQTELPEEFQAVEMMEFRERIYLNDPKQGIVVLDRFGQFEKKLPFKGVKQMLGQESSLLLLDQKGLLRYDLITKQIRQIEVKADAISIRAQEIVILLSDTLFLQTF